MSDLPCRVCREPWDHDSISEEVDERDRQGINTRDGEPTYDQVAAEFAKFGCGAFAAFTGKVDVNDAGHLDLTRCDHNGGRPDPVITAIYDLLGDDMDGAANMLEDAEAWGLL